MRTDVDFRVVRMRLQLREVVGTQALRQTALGNRGLREHVGLGIDDQRNMRISFIAGLPAQRVEHQRGVLPAIEHVVAAVRTSEAVGEQLGDFRAPSQMVNDHGR